MNVRGSFKHGARGGNSDIHFDSSEAEELSKYFRSLRRVKEDKPLLDDAGKFDAAITELADNTNISQGDFIRIFARLSLSFGHANPKQGKKWALFQSLGKHLPKLENTVRRHLKNTDSEQVGDIALAFKTLRTRPTESVMLALEERSSRHMQGATISNIANVVGSMASLGHIPKIRFINAIVPRIEKRKKSAYSKSENKDIRTILTGLATLQAITHRQGQERPDIKEAAKKILKFFNEPKTDAGLGQRVQFDTEFELGLNSVAGQTNDTKSQHEITLSQIFKEVAKDIPGLSPRETPNRIKDITKADVDFAFNYDNGEAQIPILIELEGSFHYIYGTRSDGSFGEISWNGSTILTSANKARLCRDGVILHLPYGVHNKFETEVESLAKHIFELCMNDLEAGEYELRTDPDFYQVTVTADNVDDMLNRVKIYPLHPDLTHTIEAEPDLKIGQAEPPESALA